jgi:hypothetical protein
MSRRSPLRLTLMLALFAVTGCYRNAVVAPRMDPATDWHGKTVHSLFWGLVKQRDVVAQDCEPSNSLNQVRSDTNFGYMLLTVATLGIWAPTRLEWRCGRLPEPGTGQL